MKKNAFRRASLFAMCVSLTIPASAQEHQHQARAAEGAMDHRYTAQERANGLRKGRGMGLAQAAETNGYPGPLHVLEMEKSLGLKPAQRRETQLLFNSMQARAAKLGEKLLREEAALDGLFAGQRASPAELTRLVRAAGETEAALKITHLETHIRMMSILTPAQVTKYVKLRRAGSGSGLTRPRP
jgi:hypothetical protein